MVKQTKLVPAARPFLKWAGGKTQLLEEFSKRLPAELKGKKITKYVEPFIGGGAVFFYLNRNFSFTQCYICDVNQELILSYRVIQKSVKRLISDLETLETDYLDKNEKKREEFYYEIRDSFNKNITEIDFKKYNVAWIDEVGAELEAHVPRQRPVLRERHVPLVDARQPEGRAAAVAEAARPPAEAYAAGLN